MYWVHSFTDWITPWAHSVSLDCLLGPQLTSGLPPSPQYESGMPYPTLSSYLEYSRVCCLPHGAVQPQPIRHNMSTCNR